MTNEDKMFNLMEKMYGEFVESRKDSKARFDILEQEIRKNTESIVGLEDKLMKRTEALFDGYKQNSDKLDRIENEVTKHEELIIRRLK